MSTTPTRVFEAKPAVREAVGLLIGVVGASSSGKTYSALRLATGIQQVVGGDIDVIDTENGRALYYADRFRFNHVRFGAPFSPLDYLEAVRYCAKRGSKTVLIDSMSHEHEGPGGVLEWHEQETQRLAKAWNVSPSKAQLAAWAPPKSARRKFINELLQLNVNVIATFRAKEKLKVVPGKDPQPLGWQPISGDEFIYEMTLQCLLKPGSNGVPAWDSDYDSERAIMKLPAQFVEFFTVSKDGAREFKREQLSEEMGAKLAQWAIGGSKPAPELDALIADYAKCTDLAEFQAIEKRRAAVWAKPMPAGYKARVKEASDAAISRVNSGAPTRVETDKADDTPPDDKTWKQAASSQESVKALDTQWQACLAAYKGNVPLEVESAFTFAREQLSERENEIVLT